MNNQTDVKTEEKGIKRIACKEYHSKKYFERLKATTYKNEKVVFILPNGKEYK